MVTVATETSKIVLSMHDLREVTSYAAESAQEVLEIFERAHPSDPHPRDVIDAAWAFARGGARGKALRDNAWAAHKAARHAHTAAAGDAARAAMCAASAAYLHPLADAHQVQHILGAAAHAARAAELIAGDDRGVGAEHIEQARRRAAPAAVDVLNRYPAAPPGGRRVGELLRDLDQALRGNTWGLGLHHLLGEVGCQGPPRRIGPPRVSSSLHKCSPGAAKLEKVQRDLGTCKGRGVLGSDCIAQTR